MSRAEDKARASARFDAFGRITGDDVAALMAEVRAETYRAAAMLAIAGASVRAPDGRRALESLAEVLTALAKDGAS